MSADNGVRIPKDLAKRKELYELAGLTEEERRAIDQWCDMQEREYQARKRRAMESHGNEPMP